MPPVPPSGDPVVTPRLRLRRPVIAAVLAGVLVAGTGMTVAIQQLRSPAAALAGSGAEGDEPVEMAAAPTTTTITLPLDAEESGPSTTQAAPAPRTTPAPPPPERAPAPLVRVGEIRIPKIGLVHPIYEGVTLTVVDHGPGHWPGSAMPGQLGNAVFAGHRVTHSHPFRNLDQLVPGDEIIFRTISGEFTYRMIKQEIVSPKDTWIVTPTADATVTLFACHPPGSARQRIVVRGVYVPGGADLAAAGR